MIRLSLLGILTLILTSHTMLAQAADPLGWTAPIKGRSENVFVLWNQHSATGPKISAQKIYRYLLGSDSLPPGKRWFPTQTHYDTSGVSGNEQVDVAAGYFLDSVFENIVAAWEGPGQTVQILIPRFDSTSSMWSSSNTLTVSGPVVPYDTSRGGQIYVRTGDFLGNGRDQFVLAYHGADSTIHLEVYSVDDNLQPHLLASANDETLPLVPAQLARFSLATGDLNNDGKDEIILDGVEQNHNNTGHWAVYTKIYEVENTSLTAKARVSLLDQPVAAVSGMSFKSTVAAFSGNATHEEAFACTFAQSLDANNTFIFMLEASGDLDTLTRRTQYSSKLNLGQPLGAFDITSGDFNGDGRDELAFQLGSTISLYASDDALNLSHRSSLQLYYNGPTNYDFLGAGDVNQDGRDEIIAEDAYVSVDFTPGFYLEAYAASSGLDSLEIAAATPLTYDFADESPDRYLHYAVALGNFDGRAFSIGAPVHFLQNNVVQPLVILNAPPVHFDIFNDTTYDIDDSFNGNAGSFFATYEKSNSQSVEVQTSVHNTYGVGAGIDATGSIQVAPEGIGVSANYELLLEGKLGKDFTSSSTDTKTVSISITSTANVDDQIFATISSFDAWQYPVYAGNDPTPYNYILILKPIRTDGQWYPSKSYSANTYVPNHEIGNILSYADYDSLDNNPDIEQSVQPVYRSPSFTLDATSVHDWQLTISNFQSNHADTTWTNGFDLKVNNGLEVAEANYQNANMTAQTTTVTDGIVLDAHLGMLDTHYGGIAGYTVKPYAYRDRRGALEINYAVVPDLAPQGFPPTWWQQQYGSLSDPTFILPWFYDPEKGYALIENAKRFQTHDIFFSTENPSPGDTLTLTARVRNFSLVPTPSPVPVRFYVGDPDSGGTPITGSDGAVSTQTPAGISARGWADASLRWIFPSGLPEFPRIYAVVDPSNSIPEIHESNDKGFNVLGQQLVAGIAAKSSTTLPEAPILDQAYPNPFNPSTTIRYVLPRQSRVSLQVFDLLGQEIATLANGEQTSGFHSVVFDAGALASGVYFYRLEAGAFTKTRKMLLLK